MVTKCATDLSQRIATSLAITAAGIFSDREDTNMAADV